MSDDIQPQDEGRKKQPKNGNGDRQELFSIEELAKWNNVTGHVFAGVMENENWAAGKKVSESVFQKAVYAFLKAPQGRSK